MNKAIIKVYNIKQKLVSINFILYENLVKSMIRTLYIKYPIENLTKETVWNCIDAIVGYYPFDINCINCNFYTVFQVNSMFT